MNNRTNESVILILSHVLNHDIKKHFDKIRSDTSNKYDVYYLCDNSKNVFSRYKQDPRYFLFTLNDLFALGYPGRSSARYPDQLRKNNPHHKNFNFLPGSTDLPLLHFYRNWPHYRFYWVVEYDVRFTGCWIRFFDAFDGNESDLLGTTLTRHDDIADWYHWDSLKIENPSVSERDRIRGFFPVYRLSARALAQLDADCAAGAKGHYECLVPTLLHRAGMTLEDIGGSGDFVRPCNRNRFYRNTPTDDDLSPGSFVFRPVRHRPGKEADTLWHPVKHISPLRRAVRWARSGRHPR